MYFYNILFFTDNMFFLRKISENVFSFSILLHQQYHWRQNFLIFVTFDRSFYKKKLQLYIIYFNIQSSADHNSVTETNKNKTELKIAMDSPKISAVEFSAIKYWPLEQIEIHILHASPLPVHNHPPFGRRVGRVNLLSEYSYNTPPAWYPPRIYYTTHMFTLGLLRRHDWNKHTNGMKL